MRISTIIRHCRAWRPSLRCTAATHLHDHTVELVRLLAHLFEEKHRAPVVGRIWRAAQRRQEAQVAAHQADKKDGNVPRLEAILPQRNEATLW